MKKVLFIDRDGTLIVEPPVDFQADSLEKLEFIPLVFKYLGRIVEQLDFELVMVTNQDGLGTSSFPEETFWPVQNKLLKAFENEGIVFKEIFIDKSFPEDQSDNRKPGTGMLTEYLKEQIDLKNSYVIGDREADMELAINLGVKGLRIQEGFGWNEIYTSLMNAERQAKIQRKTSETSILLNISLNGAGKSDISTGLSFFDHMLEQIAKHGLVDLSLKVNGDLQVDEHHTIEDTAIVLGEAFKEALGNKLGIERYGFTLPMDDCLAQVAIDFGGRNWIEWEVDFKREKIGDMPTEMFFHFFKSFTDAAQCNLNIKAEGKNEHHKIEAIFKAFAKAIKMAIRQDKNKMVLPSTKGVL
jgi:imidazoleglycerol-phosphate dehydratase / histidinol-phosphatase